MYEVLDGYPIIGNLDRFPSFASRGHAIGRIAMDHSIRAHPVSHRGKWPKTGFRHRVTDCFGTLSPERRKSETGRIRFLRAARLQNETAPENFLI